MEVETLRSNPGFSSTSYSIENLASDPNNPNSDIRPPECHCDRSPENMLSHLFTPECAQGVGSDEKPESGGGAQGVRIELGRERSFGGGASEDSGVEMVAAVKVQKVYRSYRTRRRLADTVVVAEELWWQAIDYARLNRSTISFFNVPETAVSRWSRISLNASKVGKGLSQDSKAQKLAFQHWIEAIDPRHRYGHNLHRYYDVWCDTNSGQPFFYWLDVGDGKDLNLADCLRLKLRKQCIQYLGPQEREEYEYIICEGKIIHLMTLELLDTRRGSGGGKWIFVMSTCKRLYVGEKKKGRFHHSSFLAGGATLAAGRLVVEDGVLKCISAYSGHYRPSNERLDSFMEFLKKKGVNLDEVQIDKANEEFSDSYDDKLSISAATSTATLKVPPQHQPDQETAIPTDQVPSLNQINTDRPESSQRGYQRTLSGGLRSPRAEVPKEAILKRINSKQGMKTYQLGHQLSRKWSTGAGPRIGCVADYPSELRLQALEFNDLSPRFLSSDPASFKRVTGVPSPRPCPE